MTDFETETEAAQPEREHRFPCAACGADMRFNAEAGELVCDHCGARQEIDEPTPQLAGIREQDFREALDARLPEAEMEETRVSTCPNCAAQIEFDADIHAAECPFCATPVVTDTGIQRQIKPQALLPFAIEEERARKAMNDWLGKLWFAPNGLQEYARKGRKMNGIYVPFWTYDADTKSRYTGQRGTEYTVTRTVMRDGKPTQVSETKVRWTPVSGRVARFFDDVLVLASKSLPKKYTDALQPWDLEALEPYRPEFLAGYRAEGYQIALSEGYDEARAYMDRVILRDIKFDIGGDRQLVSTVDTTVSDVTFKHILLPVWLAAYKFRGKSYRFVVNGRTGQVRGERPWSWIKITFAVLVGLAIAGAIGYFIAQNQ
ncbi:MAG: primosomal protein N' (replication factor Y) - superfamily II helicase [Rhodobacterales bacterium]|nr:MAG: primosomal protein N' (replication factor Y) - superfamily II helicase [Rhodobacterales bacterium]